jgi:Rieske Fe-S protein
MRGWAEVEDKLRDDFSIEWDVDRYVSRREFFKFLTLASGGLVAGSAVLAAWPALRPKADLAFPRTLVAKVGDVPAGGSAEFNYPGQNDLCILLHRRDGGFDAYSRRCTHLSCPVQFQPDEQRLFCPCHNGAFSIADGSPTQGPPTRPLRRVNLEIVEEDIYAVGVEAE